MEKNSHRVLCVLTSQAFNTITVVLLWLRPALWIILRRLLCPSVQVRLFLFSGNVLGFFLLLLFQISKFYLLFSLTHWFLITSLFRQWSSFSKLLKLGSYDLKKQNVSRVSFANYLHCASCCGFPGVQRSREEMVRLNSGGKPWMGLTFSACQAKVRNLHWP